MAPTSENTHSRQREQLLSDNRGIIYNGTDWTKDHKFIAFLSTEKTEVTAEDFAGLWVKFILDSATDIIIADAGGYFNSGNVEDVLQELGQTLVGLENLLKEI